jgi:FkbM family methyltransferase
MCKPLTRAKRFVAKHVDYHRKWKDAGLSKAEYFKLLRYPGGYLQPTTVDFRGSVTHFVSPLWFLHSVQEIFVDEVYKFAPERSDPTIIDCGANIGLSAIYFKSNCPDAKVIAFEPDPSVFELLQKNVKERKLAAVDTRNAAVWIDDSRLTFEVEGALGGRLSDTVADGRTQIGVQAFRLRDLLESPVEFLKIDIEGAEYEVLKDCRDRLQNVANLFVEYHAAPNEPQHLSEILSWLSNAGFRYYISEASRLQPHPFISKGGGVFEMQLNISCYRGAPAHA